MEKEFGGEVNDGERRPPEAGDEGSEKVNQISEKASGGSSTAPQNTSTTSSTSTAPAGVKSGGVDTTAVSSVLKSMGAFAHAASSSATSAPAAASTGAKAGGGVDTSAVLSMLGGARAALAAASSSSAASAPAAPAPAPTSGGVDTSAVLSMLQNTAAVAAAARQDGGGDGTQKAHTASMKSAHQGKTDDQPTPDVAPKEASKDRGMYVPEPFKMSQSEFDAKFEQKVRAVSRKNPDHEGLSDIKAKVLAERGHARPRSRSRERGHARPRSRSRRRDR